MSTETIKICSCHEKQVPLLWTFKFNGAEFWCPACGYIGGMFGAGINVPVTNELLECKKELEEKAFLFLSGEQEKWMYIF